VRYGRIGSDGRSQTKSFPSEAAMQASADKLISQKTGKGYEET
jgi:predicted DNA-binding WGR domain protein